MILSKNFLAYTLLHTRIPRILLRKIQLIFMLIIHSILPWFFKNRNIRHKHLRLPQPAYYNSFTDIDFQQQFQSQSCIRQSQSIYSDDSKLFDRNYATYKYNSLVKAFFPHKHSALESINAQSLWACSYWNQNNTQKPKQQKFELFRKSDVLFADMMVNTQGIYKCFKVKKDNYQIINKIKNNFKATLQKYRKYIGNYEGQCIIDCLIQQENLFYIDYPELRKTENGEASQTLRSKNNAKPYMNKMKTTIKNNVDSYIQIPFALFSKVKRYQGQNQQKLICLAAIFNQSDQVFHPFDQQDMIKRDQWEMAKCHMAAADCNDFTIRAHLGILHYASSIYTTAFVNLSKSNKNLKWLKNQFIDVFSKGLLQVNFAANLTLADHKQPIAQKIFHLQAPQSVQMMLQQNTKFNITEFDPQHLGKDKYESHSMQISNAIYKKIEFYVQYLFRKYQNSWNGKTKQMGSFIYRQVHGGDYDSIPQSICNDQTSYSLQKIITNLIYLWVVHHGQTFSNTSICNNFYFYPPMMRKSILKLRETKRQKQFDAFQKQQWLPPIDIIQDYLSLAKFVTYRSHKRSLVSKWNNMKINNQDWKKIRKYMKYQNWDQDFEDFWNDVTLQCLQISYERMKKGLFMLHWLLPHELVSTLNI